MGIILGEPAHPQQPVQDPGPFVAVHGAEFSISDGQIPVTAEMGLVNHDVERAVHGLELVLARFHLHRDEHIFPVVVQVPARPPQIETGDMRRIDQLIALLQVLLPPKILDQQANQRALRVPQNLHGDQIKLFPQFAVVPALDLLQLGQMGVQRSLCREGGAVDSLEHRVPLVAPPIGSGARQQLQRRHPAGRGDVRAPAQINKLTLAVKGRRLVLDVFENVHLVGFPPLPEEADGVLA